MIDEIPMRYCKRIRGSVCVEESPILTEKVYVQCKFYNPNPNQCVVDFVKNKKCLVRLAAEREERERQRSKSAW